MIDNMEATAEQQSIISQPETAERTQPVPQSEFPHKQTNSKLPVIIGIVAVILVLMVGAYYVKKHTVKRMPVAMKVVSVKPSVIPTAIPTPIVIPTISAISADMLVHTYYNWYTACVQNQFNKGTLNLQENINNTGSCPVNYEGVLTDALAKKLQIPVGTDPILCSQNIVQSIDFGKTIVANDTATAIIYDEPYHANGDKSNIRVGLQKLQNQWKIISVTCNNNY